MNSNSNVGCSYKLKFCAVRQPPDILDAQRSSDDTPSPKSRGLRCHIIADLKNPSWDSRLLSCRSMLFGPYFPIPFWGLSHSSICCYPRKFRSTVKWCYWRASRQPRENLLYSGKAQTPSILAPAPHQHDDDGLLCRYARYDGKQIIRDNLLLL